MNQGERLFGLGKVARGGDYLALGDKAAEGGAIAFGYAVEPGTDSELQVKLFVGGTFAGITVYDPTKGYKSYDGSGQPSWTRQYYEGDAIVQLRRGTICVPVAEAVEAEDVAYAVDATGKFGKTSGGGYTSIPGRFVSDSYTVDSVLCAMLEINLV